MGILDTVDKVAMAIALGFVLLLFGAMLACVVAMVVLSWFMLHDVTGNPTNATILWAIVWGVSAAVSWAMARAQHEPKSSDEYYL